VGREIAVHCKFVHPRRGAALQQKKRWHQAARQCNPGAILRPLPVRRRRGLMLGQSL